MDDASSKQLYDEDKRNAATSFLDLAGHWGGQIGMHGLPNITRSDSRWKKLFWTLLLLAGLGLTIFQIKTIVDKYYTFPISVQRATDIQLPRPFPAVTVCNQNPARNSQLQAAAAGAAGTPTMATSALGTPVPNSTLTPSVWHVGTSENTTAKNATLIAAATVVPNTTPGLPLPPGVGRRKRRSIGDNRLTSLTSSMYSDSTTRNLSTMGYATIPDKVGMTYNFLDYYSSLTNDAKRTIGHQLNEFLVECSIGTGYCSATNFTQFLHPMYGNCYTFNAAVTNVTRVTVKQQGPLFGLSLTLYLSQNEYVGTVAQSAGVVVVIHEPTVQPFPEESGIRISPGRETYIGLRQTYKQLLGDPYKDSCATDYSTANVNSNMYLTGGSWALPNVNYTQMACLKTCLQRTTESVCNCSSPKLPPSNITRSPALPICYYKYNSSANSISNWAKCANAAQESGFQECRASCNSECDINKYDVSMSMSTWPSSNYGRDALRQLTMYNRAIQWEISRLTTDAEKNAYVE